MLKRAGRIWLFLFVIILVSSLMVFTGCKKDVSLKGADIKVGSWWQTYNVNTYEPRNEGEERDLEWRRKIMADNGFNMEIVEVGDWDAYLPIVASNIMSGNKTYSMYHLAPTHLMPLYKQGLLAPVNQGRVSLKAREAIAGVTPMYNSLVEEFMTFDGKQYAWGTGRTNDGWGQSMLFFNSKHLTDVGLSPEYIYDLQKNNNWTWDTFLDLCRKLTRDTDGDGITDIYALPCDDPREFIGGLIFGNGGNFVTFDSQGRAQNVVNSAAVLEALEFYNQLINEGLVMTQPSYDWGWNWSAFQDEKVAMTFDPEWRKGQASFEGGYVLPPRGPRSSQLRLGVTVGGVGIPAIFSPEEVDIILKASQLWDTPTDTDWLGGHYWASSNLRDVTETVVMSRDDRFHTFEGFQLVPGYPFGEFIGDFRDGLGSKNPAQLVEQWMPSMNSAIEDFNR